MVQGVLPGGLTLDSSSGEISGTATAAETVEFMVEVIDSGAQPLRDTRRLSLTVLPPAARLQVRVFLEGPYDAAKGVMQSGYESLPSEAPYAASPLVCTAFPDSIVDWVLFG